MFFNKKHPAKAQNKILTNIGFVKTMFNNIFSIPIPEVKYKPNLAHFNKIATQTIAGVVQVDVNSKISLVNKRFCEMLGCTEDELLTMTISQVIHIDNIASFNAEVEKLTNGSLRFEIEIQLLRKDNSSFWISSCVNKMQNSNGEYQGYVAIVNDISEWKNRESALEKSEKDIQSILESVKDGFFALNNDWKFTYINKAAEIIMNAQASKNIGKSLFMVFPDIRGSIIKKNFARVKKNKKPIAFNFFYLGDKTWYEISTYPAIDGITVYFKNVNDQVNNAEIMRLRLERTRIIADISSQLVLFSSSDVQSLHKLLESVFTNVAKHLGVEYFINFRLDAETQTLRLATSYGLNSIQKELFNKVRLDKSFCNTLVQTQKPLIMENMQDIFPGKSALDNEFQIDSYAGYPLLADGILQGTVCFATMKRPNFAVEELELIKIVADLSAVALQRNLSKMEIEVSELKYRALYESIDEGYCTLEIIFDDANIPINCRYLEVNRAFEIQTGLIDATGKTFTELMPGIENSWTEIYSNVGIKGESIRFENHAEPLKRWFNCYAFCLSKVLPSRVGVIFTEITDRKCREMNQQFLAEIQLQLSLSTDLYTTLEIVGNKIRKHFKLTIFSLSDTDKSMKMASVFYSSHDDDIASPTGNHLLSNFLCEKQLKKLIDGQSLAIDDVYHAIFEKNDDCYQEFKVNAVIHTPYLIKESCKFLVTGTKRDTYHWRENEIELLKELTARVCPFIAHARAEAAVQKNEKRYRAFIEASSQIIYRLNADVTLLTLIKGNDSVVTAHKGPQSISKYIAPVDQALVMHAWQEAIFNKTTFEVEHRLPPVNGTMRWVYSRAVPLLDEAGNILEWFGAANDITERKSFEETMWQHAYYDTLTGLPNRRLFHDRLEQEIKKAHRSGLKVALFFIDLDHFKEVNDLHGHNMGDLLLVEVSNRITRCVREFDTIARLGGDEFTAILSDLDHTASSEVIAQKIIDFMAEPFNIEKEIIYLSASIGITLYPDDAKDADSLIGNADQAMYAAKSAGRNQYVYFMQKMQFKALERLRLIEDLRHAMIVGELEVNYQPIFSFKNNEIIKAEALLRWNHPAQGRIDPSVFIPFAEDAGLINAIGNWVFTEAVACAKFCIEKIGKPFQISVNKSPVQFRSSNKSLNWVDYLYINNTPANSISLEITEGLLLDISAETRETLMHYRRAGIAIAIDDFGSGYSSMAYLKQFQIDYLKIDQSFIHDITGGKSNFAIVKSMIVMAHALDIKVIAEGIETLDQYKLLQKAGCDLGQGFFFSPALSFKDFINLLEVNEAKKLTSQIDLVTDII